MDLIPLTTIAAGASAVLDPLILLWIFGGVLVGLIFGAAPGLTATAGVAIATPLTFGVSFEVAMALLLGIYVGGYFAGSIPAILINTPGARRQGRPRPQSGDNLLVYRWIYLGPCADGGGAEPCQLCP